MLSQNKILLRINVRSEDHQRKKHEMGVSHSGQGQLWLAAKIPPLQDEFHRGGSVGRWRVVVGSGGRGEKLNIYNIHVYPYIYTYIHTYIYIYRTPKMQQS